MRFFFALLPLVFAFDIEISPVSPLFGASTPPLPWLFAAGASHEIPLFNYQNVLSPQLQYRGRLFIGTPPQPFNLIVDTGSSWTWVNDAKCGVKCHTAQTFNTSQSNSYVRDGRQIILRYGSGGGKAELGYDTAGLYQDGSASARNQSILLMQQSAGFEGMMADGILVIVTQGLGLKELSDDFPTFVDNLKAQGVIQHAMFSIFISDNDFSSVDISPLKSAITFGGANLKKYAHGATPQYVKSFAVTGFWLVRVNSVEFGSTVLTTTVHAGIVDSGTSLLICPSSQLAVIQSFFCKSWNCVHEEPLVFECPKGLMGIPDLKFDIDGTDYVLTAAAYIWQEEGFCVVLIEDMGDFGHWILGDVFMRQYYTIFDLENELIGFAPSANTKPSSSLLLYFIIAAVVLIVVLLGVVFCIRKCYKPSQDAYETLAAEPTTKS